MKRKYPYESVWDSAVYIYFENYSLKYSNSNNTIIAFQTFKGEDFKYFINTLWI